MVNCESRMGERSLSLIIKRVLRQVDKDASVLGKNKFTGGTVNRLEIIELRERSLEKD